MKNYQWLSKLGQLTFGKNKSFRRKTSARNLTIESLEQRNLLATINLSSVTGGGVDPTPGESVSVSFLSDDGEADNVTLSAPTADSLQILVGSGDSLVLQGTAATNPNFVLSQTVVANDTLTIDISSLQTSLRFELGNLNDVFTASSSILLDGSLTINGGSGNDTIDASNLMSRVSLTGGEGSDQLTGGSGDDQLTGGGGADTLVGNAGNDDLAGGSGTDVIDGGLGIDTNSFAGISIGVTATIGTDGSGTATYGSVSESFSGIENLIGSDGNDTLTGNDSDNEIDGGRGNDTIFGLGGIDTLLGGDEVETGFSISIKDQPFASLTTLQSPTELVTEAAAGNLYVNIRTSQSDSFSDAGEIRGQLLVQTDSSIDGVRTLTLSASLDSAQVPNGSLMSAATGQATVTIIIDGDSVTYSAELSIDGIVTQDVTLLPLSDVSAITIANGALGVTGPVITDVVQDAGGDIVGSIFTTDPGTGELLSVNAEADTGDGDVFQETFLTDENIIDGGEGADYIIGGAGDDNIIGGAGDDILIGRNGDDILDAGDGNDSLAGQIGDDMLIGGDGDDRLSGGFGTDSIDGGAGSDTNEFEFIRFAVTATIAADGTGIAQYGSVSENFVSIENLLGSSNDDILTGNDLANVIDGGRGNDMIFGLGGDDTLSGNGSQILIGNDGSDLINGGPGNDRIIGEEGDDILRGGTGADIIRGGDGNDRLNGGDGDDILIGDDGDDFMVGIGGDDFIDGRAGIDTISFQGIGTGVTATVDADGSGSALYGTLTEGFEGIENLTGSENDDVLTVVGGTGAVLRGLGGNDILTGGSGNDALIGNEGDDILRGGGGDDSAHGGDGNDNLNGGAGNDFLDGQAGNDFFVGIGGTDTIIGGVGFDTNSFQGIGLGVTARINDDGTGTAEYGAVSEVFTGIDRLVGSSNDDTLIATGSRGTRLIGLGGDDLLIGSFGNDVLIGGEGNDTLNARGGNDLIFGNEGNDTINAGDGDDFARGDEGDDSIAGGAGNDRLAGSQGNDRLFGSAGADYLFGADGDDELFGGDEDDELRGGDGDDLLVGGLGMDLLFGGNGNDNEIQ